MARNRSAIVDTSADAFHLLVEAVQDYAIFMLDPAGLVASWNPGAERIKGYKAGEIVGKHFSCFFTPEEQAAGKPGQVLSAALSAGRYEAEGLRVRQDGSRFWAHVTLTPLLDAAGSHKGFAKVTRDITERRQADEPLVRSILDSAVDAIISIDETGVIETVNPATERIFGYERGELLGRNVRMLMPEPDRGRHDTYIGNYLRTGQRRSSASGAKWPAGEKTVPAFSFTSPSGNSGCAMAAAISRASFATSARPADGPSAAAGPEDGSRRAADRRHRP